MGAEYIEMCYSEGVTFEQAVSNAMESAAYDYGHAGYTGTMAEKEGAILCGKLPPRITLEKFSRLVAQYREWKYYGVWVNGKRVPNRWSEYRTIACPNGCQKTLDDHWTIQRREQAEGVSWELRTPEPTTCGECRRGSVRKDIIHRTSPVPKFLAKQPRFMKTLEQFTEIAEGDKWGPAAGVEANKQERAKYLKGRRGIKRGTRVFMFEGYASS